MCGIVGVASNGPMNVQMKEFFQSLLYHDIVRGAHATGVAAVDTQDRSLTVEKRALPADEFLKDKEAMDNLFAPKHNFNIYIGHNRYATMGDKTKDENAHPFVHGDVVGVHNGSLRNQSLLDDHRKFDVDSDNLYYHMSRNGLDDTIKKLDGAFSLVWYDRSDNSLNFIRNDERPMCIAKLSNGCVIWASEGGMLRWLVGRHRVLAFDTYKSEGYDVQSISQLEKGVHCKYAIGDKTRTLPRPVLTTKELPSFPYSSRYDNWMGTTTNSRIVQRPSRSPAQLKMDAVIQKFIPAGNSSSYVELEYRGKADLTTKYNTKSLVSFFNYRDMNGIDHKFHAYRHSHNPCSNWEDDKIGTKVYAQIGSVLENSDNHAELACPNTSNHSVSLFSLSLTRHANTQIMTYWTDELIQMRKTANGLPSEKKIEAGTSQGQAGTVVSLEQTRLNREMALKGNATCVDFANQHNFPADKAREHLKENGYMCSNCATRFGNMKLSSIYLLEHYDCEQGATNVYLSCSQRCNNEMEQYTQEVDAEFMKLVGNITGD